MTIYRGPGGTGEARTDSDVTEVRIIADEAEGYKDQAATSASAAASSASAAATAETNAETAETNAETAEANAEAAQAAAEAAQAAAEAAQTAAEAAQTAAELAETNAETAEANAETAEANAETAQAAAEAALASAQAVYDNFDDRYLGAKTSNPTVDNDGGALLTGALYFNTTVPEMRVYTGSSWTDFSAGAAVSSFNTRTGAVTLTDTDVNTALGYTAANNSSVLLKANNLSDLTSASTARTNLGLGTAAITASTAYATAAQGTNADTAYGWGNHASAGYAADSAVVKLTGDQTVGGTKTFSSTITGSISGNAGTVTNGVYTSGSYADPSWITSLAGSKVSGNISGNAATATTATNLSGGTVSATSISDSGNLTFTGTGNRITGDFTSVANGVYFQTSTANTVTNVAAMPNGTSNLSGFQAYSSTDPSNASVMSIGIGTSGTEAVISSFTRGTGTALPMRFNTGGSERMRVDTSGNVGIGTSSPATKLNVIGDIQLSRSATASDAAINFGSNSNNYIYSGNANNLMAFATNGSERMRIDSSGNLGIGATSTFGFKQHIAAGSSTSGQLVSSTTTGVYTNYSDATATNSPAIGGIGNNLVFATGPSSNIERARIDTSGNLLVGKTTSSTSTGAGLVLYGQSTISGYGRIDYVKTNSGTNTANEFSYNGTPVGTITYSNTATAYNTSSDYRLKNAIAPMTGALAKVALLKPCTYKWNADGSDGEGFIAHELQAVVPQCVTGEKDAVDAEGNPVYQGIDTSFLVATLTAAIQEQQAIILAQQTALTALTARVEALESN